VTHEQRAQFEAILKPLVIALGAAFDLPTWTLYARALEDVPPALLEAAVARAARSTDAQGRQWMPKPGELRQWAEEARLALVAAHPFAPCSGCSTNGWTQAGGGVYVKRCPCWTAHQERLAALGVGPERLALPAARDWTETGEQP
jgi:hypothetical protein